MTHTGAPSRIGTRATITKIITNNASRVAALLAGDVQAIDDVPPTDPVA